jgi:hypothetical protein
VPVAALTVRESRADAHVGTVGSSRSQALAVVAAVVVTVVSWSAANSGPPRARFPRAKQV